MKAASSLAAVALAALSVFVVDAQQQQAPSTANKAATKAQSKDAGKQPKSVSCRLELELDQWAQDTAWEIRGPFPYTDLVMERDYDHYDPKSSDDDEDGFLAREHFPLLVNETYSFILLDRAGNGIQGDRSSFSIYNVDSTEVPILLKKESTGDIGEGKLFKFTVRETLAPLQTSHQEEPSRPSLSSQPSSSYYSSLYSSAMATVQRYVDMVQKSIS